MTARERTPSGDDRSQPPTPRRPDGKGLQKEGGPGVFKSLGLLIGLGIELAASVAVTFFLGWYLDGKWGTAPWMMLALTTIGAGGGMYNFIRTVTMVSKEESRQKEEGPR